MSAGEQLISALITSLGNILTTIIVTWFTTFVVPAWTALAQSLGLSTP